MGRPGMSEVGIVIGGAQVLKWVVPGRRLRDAGVPRRSTIVGLVLAGVELSATVLAAGVWLRDRGVQSGVQSERLRSTRRSERRSTAPSVSPQAWIVPAGDRAVAGFNSGLPIRFSLQSAEIALQVRGRRFWTPSGILNRVR
jgi:hypothetical protein